MFLKYTPSLCTGGREGGGKKDGREIDEQVEGGITQMSRNLVRRGGRKEWEKRRERGERVVQKTGR